MNPVQHAHLVVRQAREFFDSWFDRFPTWDEFRQTGENNGLIEFGSSWDIDQISRWFGGANCPNHYEKCRKYGVGREVIGGFISSLSHDAIAKTLRILGPSDREKLMLVKMEEDRRVAIHVAADHGLQPQRVSAP